MYDLDAAYAAQREAAGEPFEFTIGGEKFAVATSDAWPVEAATLVSNGDLTGGITLILDAHEPGQAARLLAMRPTLGHLKLIFEQEAAHEGVTGGLPNSAGSPPRVSTRT